MWLIRTLNWPVPTTVGSVCVQLLGCTQLWRQSDACDPPAAMTSEPRAPSSDLAFQYTSVTRQFMSAQVSLRQIISKTDAKEGM